MKSPVRTLNKKCAGCGKNIKVSILNSMGHYDNGHYFGKMKIPVKGTGEYKKVGTSKILKKIDIVKWTGKEKKFEYWECDKCYGEALRENWLE